MNGVDEQAAELNGGAVEEAVEAVTGGFSAAVTRVFQPILQPIFQPMNAWFEPIPPFFWKFSAAVLFIAAIVFVWVVLRKEYVNLDAPGEGLRYDLRVWTILALIPHMIIYLVVF